MNDKATDTNPGPAAFKLTTDPETLPVSFPAQVWKKLSCVDVGDHIQTAEIKKDGRVVYTYSYLGWAWCLATLMQHYPESIFVIKPADTLPDGSVIVNLQIAIIEGNQEMSRFMYLPVMDGRNNAVLNPNTRNINDTRMRCLVKALAMHTGLGLDLWTGTDYPVGAEGAPLDDNQFKLLEGLFEKLTTDSQEAFNRYLGPLKAIPKSKYDAARKGLESKLKQQSKT
jgi:hypothetical protein